MADHPDTIGSAARTYRPGRARGDSQRRADTMRDMRYAIAIPQFYADGEFDPAAFRAYFARVEELGYHSAWTQESVLGPSHQLAPIEAMTYAAACTQRLRRGRRRHRRQGSAVRRLRRGSAALRGAVHRGDRPDEGAVDRTPRHLRRRVLAAAGRGHGAQAVPEAAPAALDRCGRADGRAPGRPPR